MNSPVEVSSGNYGWHEPACDGDPTAVDAGDRAGHQHLAAVCVVPDLGTLQRRQLAALAGVAPHPTQSGSSVRTRERSRGGRATVTRALFLAARVVVRSNPSFPGDVDRSMQRPGTDDTMGIIEVANKMLTLRSVMVRDGLLGAETHAAKRVQTAPSP